jgi:hypothetical protein
MLDPHYPTVELVEPIEKAIEFWPDYVATLYVDKIHQYKFSGSH